MTLSQSSYRTEGKRTVSIAFLATLLATFIEKPGFATKVATKTSTKTSNRAHPFSSEVVSLKGMGGLPRRPSPEPERPGRRHDHEGRFCDFGAACCSRGIRS